MCGICGVLNFGTHEPADPARLKRAADAMAHRGPDDEGFYLDGELGLGNRRLSIIDLPGGHQPLSNEDGSLWISFNGEIYNYRELRKQLEGRHQLRTASDTEVILHLYEDYGAGLLEHLRGMFAFALWDRRRRRLLLARDRIGIKPLYWLNEPGRLAFASELRALRELATRPLETDPQSVYDFFGFRYVPAPNTFYRNVSKLLPGHFLTADSNGIRQERYWDLPERRRDAAGRGGLRRAGSGDAARVGAAAPGGRRSAGRVPQRRRRFHRHRGHDVRPGCAAAADVFRGL